MYVQSGVGNLGTESVFDVHRVAADLMGMPWEKVTIAWGDTSQNLPWTCVSGGSQTTHAMTRAAHAAASDAVAKAQEIAAKVMGGSPAAYKLANERISGPGGSMSLADVAKRAIQMGGKFDGHELPENINKVTTASATALAGQGLMGVARDTYKRDGTSFSFVAGFAEVEVDVETGAYRVVDYTAIGDSGTIIHPRAYKGQLMGRSVLGMGHALAQKTVYDQHYGLALATRMYQSRPPTILDIPRNMKGEALDIPDPETPVGARGIGEPPVAAGACAILNALSDALGDDIYRRAPVTLDTILMALEHGRPMQDPLTANI
jgi:xanthine dehydrogenase molybdenum-binding subunit